MTEQIPENLKYTKTHEWVRVETDGTWVVGITAHAQHLLGDLVYVQLPEMQTQAQTGVEVCVLESVKAAADVYSPADGVIVAVNTSLNQQPELINQDPYEQGWLFRLQPDNASTATLLSAADYAKENS